MDRLWASQDMVWVLGSLCQLNKLPFDPALVSQQHPPPHSETAFTEAATALGFKVGRCDTKRRKLSDLTFPFVAYLRDSGTAGILRAQQRHQEGARITVGGTDLYTDAGDSKFMRRKLEAVKRELKAHGSVQDQTDYQTLLNVRADVRQRWQAAIDLLRNKGREAEARRFEPTLAHLPGVRTEKQLIAEALMVQRDTGPPMPWTR